MRQIIEGKCFVIIDNSGYRGRMFPVTIYNSVDRETYTVINDDWGDRAQNVFSHKW